MNEFQQPFGQPQFAPQGLGSMFGGALGGAVGRGIGGWFGNSGAGGRIGEMAGNFLGHLSPFSVDPAAAMGVQQQIDPQQLQQLQQMQQLQQLQQLQQQQQMQQLQGQLTPQGGFFGNLISTIGKPAGALVGNLTGNRHLGNMISDYSGYARLLPLGADPQGQQQVQQQHPMVQLQQLQAQQQQLQQLLQQVQQQAVMLQQQIVQQGGQLAPQGWLSNAITQYARPVGGFIGEQLGNQGLGAAIGGVAAQLGRYMPASVDPYGQQFGNQLGGQLGGQFTGQQAQYGQSGQFGQQTVH